jgi:predicted esterase
MKKSVVLIFLLIAFLNVFAQNKDTANISITNYKLYPGTFSWRGNDQFFDMTSWDSSPYLQGHLKQGTQFKMNYRLLPPLSYNAQYSPGYPLIVMLHGAGERGNCWNDNCYCPDPAGCNPNSTPIANTDTRFLNNDHNLVHGGFPHLSARNSAAGKLPNDPTLSTKSFPGFVLFPQNTNQWRNTGSPGNSDVSNAIRIIRLISKQYNIDQDRIYIHGLSMGAQALLEALNYADWLFAAAAPMSPINFQQSLEYDSVRNIPFWIFQGGQDLNPKPAETEGMITSLRAKGANVRYSLYPNLGHGTWNTAYAEPDFFSWLLSHNKSSIHVDYGKPNICGTTGEGASLVLPQGFKAYQWERDGVIIFGATSHTYTANVVGVYRARYSRISGNPSESEWNRWSDPVNVGEKSPEIPVIEQLGTNILSDLNLGSTAYLKVPENFEKYTWFQNGGTPLKALVPQPDAPYIFTHTGCTGGGACQHSGEYTLITEGFDKCPSLPSEPITIIFGTHNTVTVPPAITGTPNNFTFELKSPTSVLLKWSDQSTNERGFEIWRRKLLNIPGEDFNKGWVMATITKEDITLFLDTDLEPASTYYYKIRAVNNTGRSNYFPGNSQGNVNQNRVVTTDPEVVLPTPPTNVLAMTVALNTIRLTWDASTDNSGIKQYYVYYSGDSVATGSNDATFTLTNLPINQEYNFTVKAQDISGNLSLPSNPSNAHTYVSGLYYKHSTGVWSTMAQMSDTWVNPEFTGWVSGFTLQERTQEDFFNFEFQGFLYITTAGTYNFRTTSDDGSQLFLDNVMVVNNDGLHGNVTVTSSNLTLAAGPVPILARYFENTGGQTLTVQYRGPDTGNNWVNIPASALKSGSAPPLPVPPLAPSNLVATATGMQSIDLTWDVNAPPVPSYEIQRALEQAGPFVAVSQSVVNTFSDNGLMPDHTYYYRIRATAVDTVSAFTAVVNATTSPDTQSPTQPGTPVLHRSGLASVSITWPVSSDNVGVASYEIYANNILIGTSSINAFQASDLLPSTSYSFTVIALDGNNNKSTPSFALIQSTSSGTLFYSQNGATELNNLNSWKTSGGVAPTSFKDNGQVFVVKHAIPVGSAWSVEGTISKVVIDNAVTLTIDTHPINATIDINGSGTLNLVTATLPKLGTLSLASKVKYSSASVQQANYGNLELNGTGPFTFEEGLTQVQGNLTAANGVSLKGASSNGTTIDLKGNLVMNGTPGALANSFGAALNLSGNGTQNITAGGDPGLYEIKKTGTGTVNLINSGDPFTLSLGSPAGGGLTFVNGSEFNLGDNNLSISGAGTINPNGETGTLSMNGSMIDIHSSATENSHLSFSAVNNTVKRILFDQSGGGHSYFHSPVNITAGLKIVNGTVHADGNITLMSTAAETANLEEIENDGNISGAIMVQRYLAQNPNIFRYISSSVEGTTIADWQNFFAITGPFVGASSGGTQSSVFVFSDPQWVGYPLSTNPSPFHDSQAPVEKGKGYAAFIIENTPLVIQTSGVPYQGNIAFTVSPPLASTPDNGWNLLGNPYASTIKWSDDVGAWQSNHINSIVSIQNNINTTIGQFEYYDAVTRTGTGSALPNGKIAPGQAFWIQAVPGGTAGLTITEKAKIAEQQSSVGSAESTASHIKLSLSNGALSDGAVIAITSYGTDGYDAAYDGFKRKNEGMFNFSSLTEDGIAVAINNSGDEFCAKQVKLNLQDVPPGPYSISIESTGTLVGIESVQLVDHFTNTSIELSQTPTYSFQVTADALSFGEDRFEIIMSRSAIELSVTPEVTTICGQPVQVTLVNTQAGVTYALYNTDDEELAVYPNSTGQDIIFELPSTAVVDGPNTLVVKASLPGCSSAEIPQNIFFDYYHAATVEVSDVSVCYGSTATLEASSTSSVATFEWYLDDTIVDGNSTASLTTAPVVAESYYSVIAVQPDGCKGPQEFVTVSPIQLDDPIILQNADSIYVTVENEQYEWFRDGASVAVTDKPSFIPTTSGSYSVKIASGECFKISDEVEFIVTGILDETLDSFQCQVFPNPTAAQNINLKVASPVMDEITVRIVDLVGKPLLIKTYRYAEWKDILTIHSEKISDAGVYFVIVEQKSNRSVVKLLIE